MIKAEKQASKITIIIVFMLIAGCNSTFFYREGTSFDICKKDNKECSYRARLEHPYGFWSLGPCQLYKYRKECMELRGYKLLKYEELPSCVRRIESYQERARFGGSAGE